MINITQSMDGAVSGQELTLTCTVTVVDGVESNVTISWTGPLSSSPLSSSPRVTISDQTNNVVVYTRTVTFSPVLNGDGGQYNCSVVVTGFDEASNFDDVMVLVNSKCTSVPHLPISTLIHISHCTYLTFSTCTLIE